jgi:hypothetical protein
MLLLIKNLNVWLQAFLNVNFLKIRSRAGEVSFGMIILGAIFIASYAMFPELYHGFVRWVVHSFKEAMDDSFSGYGEKRKNPNIRDLKGDENIQKQK